MSTGMICAWTFGLPSIDLSTPFPPATRTPTGPFRLSTHPGIGSLNEGTTGNYITNKLLKLRLKAFPSTVQLPRSAKPSWLLAPRIKKLRLGKICTKLHTQTPLPPRNRFRTNWMFWASSKLSLLKIL